MSVKITKDQIKDMYATFKQLSDSYSEKDSSLSDAKWLSRQYKIAFPNLSENEAEELGNMTINGVKRFDVTLKEALEAASEGKNKEQWFSEKMSQEFEGMDISEVGGMVHTADSALLQGTQIMAEGEPIQIDGEVLNVDSMENAALPIVSDVNDRQWNKFTVKEALSHLGQSASFMGLQTMNNSSVLDFTADAVGDLADSNGNFKALIENGDMEQLKTLLTATIKICADNKRFSIIPESTSVDTIANIAAHGVEYISTLSKFSNGEITMIQAMDYVGLSGVSLLYNLLSEEGIRNISTALLSQIPIIGPVLGNIVGGIVSITMGKKFHEKIHTAVQKIEVTVRAAVNNAWNKIKAAGQKIKEKVKDFCQWLFA
jgi:hypothetical protein